MKTVERYLDEMFAGLPQTEEMWQQKQRMITAAYQEYDQLIQIGTSPQNAVARIMSELRSVEHQTYGTTETQPAQFDFAGDVSKPVVNLSMAREVIASGKANALLKAGGVGAILAGTAVADFSEFSKYFLGDILAQMVESVSSMFFLLLLVAAILGFIKSKKHKHRFDFLKRGCNLTRSTVREWEAFLSFGFDLHKSQVVGIVLCILGPIVSSFFDELPMGWIPVISNPLMFLILAAGVFILVYRGQMKKLMGQIRDLLMAGKRIDRE